MYSLHRPERRAAAAAAAALTAEGGSLWSRCAPLSGPSSPGSNTAAPSCGQRYLKGEREEEVGVGGWVGGRELRGKLTVPAMAPGKCVRNCARKLRLDFIVASVREVYLGNSRIR